MPENLQELLKNKVVLYSVIGAVVLVLLLVLITGAVVATKGGDGAEKVPIEKPIKEPLSLFTTDNIGKAIEVQALLAREGITVHRKDEGSKTTLFLKNYKPSERDRALLSIVSSGLMDQFTGLEIFDKGDFTSTKEDKRIRLVRAINGELSRLIRKIKPIENASVFVSIPEQTMFTADKKPVTATVQLVIPSGEKLDRSKIKTIENLLLGSISGLESENISITDTNGNVYDSISNTVDDQLSKIEENDKYMKNKISSQLDRLIGKGKYVVTVSTFLRQVPIEKTSIIYDPDSKTSVSEQTFTEGLGDKTQDSNKGLNAVSVYLPNGLPASGSDSSQNRSYSRTARETQYGISKTQINEYSKPGVIEQVSIAVTIDSSAMPANITMDELKEMIADSASPKVSADDVSVVYSDSIDPYLASDRPVNLPSPDKTGNPWWITIAIVAIGLTGGFAYVSKKLNEKAQRQSEEVTALKQKTAEQEKQLLDVNLKASQLIEKQAQMAQGLMQQQQVVAQQLAAQSAAVAAAASGVAVNPKPIGQQQAQQASVPENTGGDDVEELLEDVTSGIELGDDDEMLDKVKSWIEKS
ncbi:MAG: flagellar M-ring protein FliF C-terminal domain-containing protein [Candidatus Gastranaerophilaceae bacterium]